MGNVDVTKWVPYTNNNETDICKVGEECPHPERWNVLRDDFYTTEREIMEFMYGLVRGLQPELVIETGARLGLMSARIGRAILENGHGKAICIEMDSTLIASANVAVANLPVQIIHCPTQAFTMMDGEHIDLAYIDGAQDRVSEFMRLKRWMSTRSIVVFHDTGTKNYARPMVESLADEGLIVPVFLPTPRGLAICQVLA